MSSAKAVPLILNEYVGFRIPKWRPVKDQGHATGTTECGIDGQPKNWDRTCVEE